LEEKQKVLDLEGRLREASTVLGEKQHALGMCKQELERSQQDKKALRKKLAQQIAHVEDIKKCNAK
jgi:hypothetical protein